MCSVLQVGVKRNVFGVAGWSKAEGCSDHKRETGICEQNDCLTS